MVTSTEFPVRRIKLSIIGIKKFGEMVIARLFQYKIFSKNQMNIDCRIENRCIMPTIIAGDFFTIRLYSEKRLEVCIWKYCNLPFIQRKRLIAEVAPEIKQDIIL